MNQTEYFKDRKAVLEKEIAELERELALMPEGCLTISKRQRKGKEYISYYKEIKTSEGKQKIYLSREKVDEAKILALKAYKWRMLQDNKNELEAIKHYLKYRINSHYLEMLNPLSPYRPLLVDGKSTPEIWESEPYEKSKDHPEHLIVKAPKGEFVRSKSEAMIAQVLYTKGIPYRYENIHDINRVSIASDFTIMNPKTSEIKIWEHFGLCDKPYYQSTIDFKMHHYIRAGYLPGHNLILTYEDEAHPLSFIEVEELVKKHFS